MELRKKFVINAAFYGIILLLLVCTYQYIIPILMPFIVGFVVASGINYTLSHTVAGGVGFTGITVAWLAQLNTFAMIAISFLLAMLSKGSSTINTLTGNMIPASMSDMLTGLILFCMLGSEFFIRYRLIWRKKPGKASKKEVKA